jgi:hypothetical protein
MPPPYSAPTVSGDPTNVMGRRIFSHIVDLILLAVIVAVLFFATANKIENVPTGYCTDSQFSSQRTHSCVQFGNTAYELDSGRTGGGLALSLGYWTLVGMIEGATGAFLGKRMLGLRVVNGQGNLAGTGRGAARGALMIIDSTFCFLIGLITASVTHPHRRIGDMAAGTFVVAKESMGRPIPTASASYIPYAPAPQQQHQQQPAPTAGGGFAPGTYGTSLPPSASTPAPAQPAWGTTPQAAEPAAQPQPELQAQPEAQAQPAVTEPQVQSPPAAAAPQPPQPQWDPARNAWIVWDPSRGQWLQWDAAKSQWGPIS